ncbi:hypothetical protein MJL81_29145, partial [Salmonella enterica subsp. enterica serovar Anatum]|nr:hypothetical protein [Salmonella enterica subsp. enterica serovar Anatum]
MILTDKPLSFGYSVVDSHSSCRPVKAKTRRSGFYEEVKLTDKGQVQILSVRDGVGGQSHTQQKQTLSLPANQPIELSRLSVNISS